MKISLNHIQQQTPVSLEEKSPTLSVSKNFVNTELVELLENPQTSTFVINTVKKKAAQHLSNADFPSEVLTSDYTKKILESSQENGYERRQNSFANYYTQAINSGQDHEDAKAEAIRWLLEDVMAAHIKKLAGSFFGYNADKTEKEVFMMCAKYWHDTSKYKFLNGEDITQAFDLCRELRATGSKNLEHYQIFTVEFFHKILDNYLKVRRIVLSACSDIGNTRGVLQLAAPDEEEQKRQLNELARTQIISDIISHKSKNLNWRSAKDIPHHYCTLPVAKSLKERGDIKDLTGNEFPSFCQDWAKSNPCPKPELKTGYEIEKDPFTFSQPTEEEKAERKKFRDFLLPEFIRQRIWDIVAPYSGDAKNVHAIEFLKSVQQQASQPSNGRSSKALPFASDVYRAQFHDLPEAQQIAQTLKDEQGGRVAALGLIAAMGDDGRKLLLRQLRAKLSLNEAVEHQREWSADNTMVAAEIIALIAKFCAVE